MPRGSSSSSRLSFDPEGSQTLNGKSLRTEGLRLSEAPRSGSEPKWSERLAAWMNGRMLNMDGRHDSPEASARREPVLIQQRTP